MMKVPQTVCGIAWEGRELKEPLMSRRKLPSPDLSEPGFWIACLMAILFVVTTSGCTNMQPMRGDWSTLPDADVARIQNELPGISIEAIRDPQVQYVHEVKVPCSRLMEICYPSLPLYQKLLGAIPLACTQTFQHAWRDEHGEINETAKTAMIYSCWATPDAVMAHEHRHAKGEMHAWF
jgi:hypothetical protein